jgi:hypothetical protein
MKQLMCESQILQNCCNLLLDEGLQKYLKMDTAMVTHYKHTSLTS